MKWDWENCYSIHFSLLPELILKIALLKKVFLLKMMTVDECTTTKVAVSFQTILHLLSVGTLLIIKHSEHPTCYTGWW